MEYEQERGLGVYLSDNGSRVIVPFHFEFKTVNLLVPTSLLHKVGLTLETEVFRQI